MSKMTPEQKAANKAAQKVRDRAFTARRREYYKARDEAEHMAEESAFARRREQAVEAMDKEWRARNEACKAIENKIIELQEKLERTKKLFAMSMEPKKSDRDAAVREFHAHVDHLRDLVDERFPGMKDCRYVSQWQIPADVQAEMDAAAKETISCEKVVAHI